MIDGHQNLTGAYNGIINTTNNTSIQYSSVLDDIQNKTAAIEKTLDTVLASIERLTSLVAGDTEDKNVKVSKGYGFCPTCEAPGIDRERRLGGNDRCANGHSYKSSSSLLSRTFK